MRIFLNSGQVENKDKRDRQIYKVIGLSAYEPECISEDKEFLDEIENELNQSFIAKLQEQS